jgi:hypothetical protein
MESSPWDGDGNNILILPSILSIIPNQAINTMYSELEDLKFTAAGESVEAGSGEDEVQ